MAIYDDLITPEKIFSLPEIFVEHYPVEKEFTLFTLVGPALQPTLATVYQTEAN